jgi:DNA polymerase-1
MAKILIFDGDYLLHRYMNSTQVASLRTRDGFPTGLVFGFLRTLKSTIDSFNSDRVIVAFSKGRCKFRESIYPSYKLYDKRDDQDSDWNKQFLDFNMTKRDWFSQQKSVLIQALPHFGVHVGRLEDHESDDVAGIIVNFWNREDELIFISDDYDYVQVLGLRKNTGLYRPMGDELYYTEDEDSMKRFIEKFGCTPDRFIYVKAIVGDDSDNIPGVANGLGEVNALKLVNQIENPGNIALSIENLVRLSENSSSPIQHKLFENQEILKRNMKLVDWRFIPIDLTEIASIIDPPQLTFDYKYVDEFIEKLELNSLSVILTDSSFMKLY